MPEGAEPDVVERPEPHERIQAQTNAFGRRRQRIRQIVGSDVFQGTALNKGVDHGRKRRGVALVADRAERLSGTSLYDRFTVFQRVEQRGTRRCIANQAERKRGHLPNLELGIAERLL
jgi:hypothetical protein